MHQESGAPKSATALHQRTSGPGSRTVHLLLTQLHNAVYYYFFNFTFIIFFGNADDDDDDDDAKPGAFLIWNTLLFP